MNFKEKKILVCPLGWGIGHTTRMIPLIRELKTLHNEVLFAGSGWQTEIVRKEINDIPFVYFPGFEIKYSAILPQYIVIFFYTPLFWYHTIREHIQLNRIIRKYNINIVISDSRLGLWNKKIISVLVTHIIKLPLPKGFRLFEKFLLPLSRAVISRFTFCFIPDFPGEMNLSGNLSHSFRLPLNTRYIGILSRFQQTCQMEEHAERDIFCTAIMSGPSPQKEILTEKIKDILKKINKKSVIFSGNPDLESCETQEGNVTVVNHLQQDFMLKIIRRSELIISRSGYTTIMELFSIGRSALLVPTPGQAEQEYLASYLCSKSWFRYVRQKDLAVVSVTRFKEPLLPSIQAGESRRLLLHALAELMEK
ncbi:MAG: glycosyltransferase [Bacteroidales bacterium]